MPEIPRMLTIAETASVFGVSKYHVRMLALSGKVAAVRVGTGKILINADSVTAYFNTCTLLDVETPAGGIRPIPAKL